MKVSLGWLKELVDLKVSMDEVIRLIPLRTIGISEEASSYIELDMKGYNRADLLSMRGVAYEIAAITDSKVTFKEPDPEHFIWANQTLPNTQVKVEDEKLCPLYCIAKISGLKVSPSKSEWVKKLADSGTRSVNNVADVTNLVMLEYGQPMHAFDASQVKDGNLIVRTAKEDERLITLDGKVRELKTSDLLITDPEKAVGLAGVMGGKNSEVTDSTNTILLEAAIFDPVTLRKTANRLGLQSEASKRFQHGLTKKRLLQALDAAIRMYEELGGKPEALSIVGDTKDQVKKITLRQEKINSLVGVEIKPEEVEKFLTKLHFNLSSHLTGVRTKHLEGGQVWEVEPPYFRLDIDLEVDVIEEVARMYGYENIPAKELPGELPEKIDQSLFELLYGIKKELANLGLTQVETYSFYSTKVIENLKMKIENLIRIANPMSKETEYMRDKLWPNLLEKVGDNLKNFKEVAIFEVGKVYWPGDKEPKEKYHLAIALSSDGDQQIRELYAIFQKLASHIGSGSTKIEDHEMDEEEKQLFHPVRFVKLVKDGEVVGIITEVHPRITNKFGIEKRVVILEVKIS